MDILNTQIIIHTNYWNLLENLEKQNLKLFIIERERSPTMCTHVKFQK